MKIKAVIAGLIVGVLALAGCTTPAPQDTSSPAATSVAAKELHIYVMRHGKTMLNTTDRVQGWSDAVLTPEGEEVVGFAGVGLKDVEFQAAYSSDSGRAMQTGQIVLDNSVTSKDLVIHPDKRFREFNFGSYEGDLNHTLISDVVARMGITMEEFSKVITPQAYADHAHELDKERTKDSTLSNWPAENFAQVQERLVDGLDALVEAEKAKPGSGNILLASHGLSIETMMTTLFTDDYIKPEGGFKNASVSIIKYVDGKYSLEKTGSLEYVEAGKNAKK